VPAPVIVSELTVRYGARVALEDVTLEIPRGTTLGIIGPNGSGKSTLLRAIAGLVSPDHGAIEVGDSSVALVLQSTDLDRALPITVTETVRMARYAIRGPFRPLRGEDHDVVRESLERLDIADLGDRQIHELSGGQRQRVLVAQGLAQQADVLLLDEPVTGLDLVSRERILRVADEERAAGRSVVTTTHLLEDARRCDRVLLLSTRAVAVGPPDEVLVEHHLRDAFGGRLLRLQSGELLVDDPHHTH
jgi:ABC-type Mn2+/Zn2+ transport system ATPase subunit